MTTLMTTTRFKATPRRYRTGHRWGHWRFNRRALVLEYITDNGNWVYEVDLERCRTSTEILDWLCQLSAKRWVSAEDIGHLVKALDQLAGRLQSVLCGCGVEHGPIDWRQLISVEEALRYNLAIKINHSGEAAQCAICHEPVQPVIGADLYLGNAEEVVCWGCGRRYAPELVALLETLPKPTPDTCPVCSAEEVPF